MFRVMGNRLGYGTFVAEDRLPSEELANERAAKLNKTQAKKALKKREHFFPQEYEEGREV